MSVNLEQIEIICPFCKKGKCRAIKQEETIRPFKGPWGGKPAMRRTPERIEILSCCDKCGKTKEEIQKALRHGVKSKEKDKKMLERLKSQGIDFSNVETKF